MRVGAVDAVALLKLTGAEAFVGIEAPKAFEESLTAQDFVEASDATGEAVGGIEEGGVAVGDLDGAGEELRRNGRGGISEAAALGMELDGAASPDGPMA